MLRKEAKDKEEKADKKAKKRTEKEHEKRTPIAASASCSVANSTNPKPRLLFPSGLRATTASMITPNGAKGCTQIRSSHFEREVANDEATGVLQEEVKREREGGRRGAKEIKHITHIGRQKQHIGRQISVKSRKCKHFKTIKRYCDNQNS